MKPEINIITLGVNDLNESLEFYRDGLGLATPGIVGDKFKGDETQPAGAVVMFKLNRELILALYPRSELSKDSKHDLAAPSSTEFSLGQFVSSKEAVDELMKKARVAGAIITDKARQRPWGIYSGYFKDLDGHLWEIISKPNA
jgi:uncharacterized protein